MLLMRQIDLKAGIPQMRRISLRKMCTSPKLLLHLNNLLKDRLLLSFLPMDKDKHKSVFNLAPLAQTPQGSQQQSYPTADLQERVYQ